MTGGRGGDEAGSGVRIYAWNPRKPILPARIDRRLPFTLGFRANNFGDLLGPMIVGRILELNGVDAGRPLRDCTLMNLGSVLHFARSGDVVWGTGVNGKVAPDQYAFDELDVRAVRGPLTRAFLEERGIPAPAVYGDPGLLLPELMPELFEARERVSHELTIVPNLNDHAAFRGDPRVLDPTWPVERCLTRIASSRFVTGSSLHGIVVAEALGIPARLMASAVEPPFKYEDYYRGTGRSGVEAAASVQEATALGGREPPWFDRDALLAAFPLDLWSRG